MHWARLSLLTVVNAVHVMAFEAPEARLLRFPDIHRDFVVFVHGGDIWRSPVKGGVARQLTSHPGQELFPKISPDGMWIAYTAEYTGTRQVYVMPASGGQSRQLTFYNDMGPLPMRSGYDYWIQGWTNDNQILVRMNRVPWDERAGRYYLVNPNGGLEKPLAFLTGGSASLSPEGGKLAYCPIDREFRTWKRTKGGRAQDIWVYDFATEKSERLTDYRGTDNFPMWVGDKIYFTSDRDHTLNLHCLDPKTKKIQKLTDFQEYDVLWPSKGPDAIVFMNGGWLYRLDLGTHKVEKLAIEMGAEKPFLVPSFKDVKANAVTGKLSPSGARVLLEARGEIFSVPAKQGATRNLTLTPGVREMSPSWSPDGKWIAYLSDESGEYEIYLRLQDGNGKPRRLTQGGDVWKHPPVWSPDSSKLAFGDKKQRLCIVDVSSGQVQVADTSDQREVNYYSWSPDSRWMAFLKGYSTRMRGTALYSLDQKKSFPLGDGLSDDFCPVWSQDGKYLFFLSSRNFNLSFSSFESDFVYNAADRVYVATLAQDGPLLFPLKNDEEKAKGEDNKPVAKAAVKVDLEGIRERTVVLPGLVSGEYQNLLCTQDAVFYLRALNGVRALYRYDLKECKEDKLLDGVRQYDLSQDGQKLLYESSNVWGIIDAKSGARQGELDLSGLRIKHDPKVEHQQIFNDAWRIFRDWFYDPIMHSRDWPAMKARYGQLVPFVAHRSELDWLIGEMIGELEAGHTYIDGGDLFKVPRIAGGLLGCEFELDKSNRYRISRIFKGENWDDTFKSPLSGPGVGVKAGEYLLAIDGQDLLGTDNPYRLLEDKADKLVQLTISNRSDGKETRQVTVKALGTEKDLRYMDWVQSRMELVNRLSKGRIGYLHLPNTSQEGHRMMQKFFYGQVAKKALIIDDRSNGGGFIPITLLDFLARKTQMFWARRNIPSNRTPEFAHDGPKAMLINGYSASGGDCLPYFFKKNGLGILVGSRTWGGLIGLSGVPTLMDGGVPSVPTFRAYDRESGTGQGRWVIENEGVSPDYEVFDLPESLAKGGDPSIEKAVELLLQSLEKHPVVEPTRPVPPKH